MSPKKANSSKRELPEYVDPEIVDIEELDIGGYVELATRAEE